MHLPIPDLPLHRARLDNGLRLVLAPDRSLPLVAINLWYHVGSKDERPGKTGFAHLFEHMLFQGSEHVGTNDHFRYLQQVGGVANGSTWYDRTNYYETLPSHYLDLGLWLESDRMGFLLPAMTPEKLETQRSVVMNERRERIDNQPYGLAMERLHELLYPAGHPYRWPVIGYMDDIEAAALDDVTSFFETWYRPDNAVLTLVGDFEPDEASSSIEDYFGEIPSGAARPRAVSVGEGHTAPGRATLPDDVELPRVYLAWRGPAYGTEDWYALDLLASALAEGKASPLYRDLVYTRQIAQAASASVLPLELEGPFLAVATAKAEVPADRLEEALLEHVRNATTTPLATEVLDTARAPSPDRTGRGVAELRESSRRAVAGDDVLRRARARARRGPPVSRAHSRPDLGSRAALPRLGPRHPPRRADGPRMSPPSIDRSVPPTLPPLRPFRFPDIERHAVHPGVDLFAIARRGLPLVSIEVLWRRGAALEAGWRRGLASLAGGLLDEGTAELTALEIAEAFEALGGHLTSSADWDGTYLGTTVTSDRMLEALDLIGRVVAAPTFPDYEVERLRAQRLTELQRRAALPAQIAVRHLLRLVYPEHVYGETLIGSRDSVAAIGRDDVARWHRRHLASAPVHVLVTGHFDVDEAREAIADALAPSPAEGSSEVLPDAPDGSRRVVVVDRPDAPQTELRLGHSGPPRSHPDRVPLSVMATLFGGKFTSRINLRLREELAITYGARCSLPSRRGPGPVVVGTAVNTEAAGRAAIEILQGMQRLQNEEPEEGEVADARNYILGTFPYTLQGVEGLLGRLEQVVVHALDLDHYRGLPAEIRSVTPADVRRVARDHLRPSDVAIVAVGPAKVLAEQLGELGDLEVLGPRDAVA